VVTTYSSNADTVIELPPGDPLLARAKFLELKKIVDDEMGFCNDGDDRSKTAYIYVVGKKAVGFVTCEIVKEAYRLVDVEENYEVSL